MSYVNMPAPHPRPVLQVLSHVPGIGSQTPVIPALRAQVPEDCCVFNPDLGYIVKIMPARATWQDPVSKNTNTPKVATAAPPKFLVLKIITVSILLSFQRRSVRQVFSLIISRSVTMLLPCLSLLKTFPAIGVRCDA